MFFCVQNILVANSFIYQIRTIVSNTQVIHECQESSAENLLCLVLMVQRL